MICFSRGDGGDPDRRRSHSGRLGRRTRAPISPAENDVWRRSGHRKPPSLRRIAGRAGYAPSHVRDVINGIGRPSPDAVAAVAGALNATDEDKRLAVFYAEQLQRSPARRRAEPQPVNRLRTIRPIPRELPHDVRDFAGRDAELARLDRYADASSGTLVISAIDGTAGVGKPKP
jgi:transcriptional regulator with XRE-family HTH domain